MKPSLYPGSAAPYGRWLTSAVRSTQARITRTLESIKYSELTYTETQPWPDLRPRQRSGWVRRLRSRAAANPVAVSVSSESLPPSAELAERTPDGITWYTRRGCSVDQVRGVAPTGYYDLGVRAGFQDGGSCVLAGAWTSNLAAQARRSAHFASQRAEATGRSDSPPLRHQPSRARFRHISKCSPAFRQRGGASTRSACSSMPTTFETGCPMDFLPPSMHPNRGDATGLATVPDFGHVFNPLYGQQ